MAIGKPRAVLGPLRTLFDVGALRELTDGQLLERFATGPGEAAELAFAALVERHGPMVLRVCRGVLANPHDCQDAFQATFLVLVRRARVLWVHDSLGPWLHQVAYRTALCARRADARRRRFERRAATPADAVSVSRVDGADGLEAAIHEEINRLPEGFRVPIVLCDLGGRTHEQAARHLGWPVGTVKSRLARGRERLRDRLRRRGLGPEPGLLAAIPRPEVPLPTTLLHVTTVAALRLATSRTFLDGGAAATLAHGVLRSMIVMQCLKGAALVLVAGATAFGFGASGQDPAPGGEARAKETPGPSPAGGGPTPAAEEARTIRATPGPLLASVSERGTLESSKNIDVFCLVEGGTSIIVIVPEGTRVQKGDVVCELDSAALRDQFTNQVIATQGAKAAYQNAKLSREIAEIAVTEYQEGVFRQQEAALLGEIATAESAIRRAGARLDRTRRARQRLDDVVAPKGKDLAPADIVAQLDLDDRLDDAEQLLAREKHSLEQAKTRHDVLRRFTKDKTIKELRSAVEKARSDERAKDQTLDLEMRKQAKLDIQIKNCTLRAPSDGVVVYASEPSRSADGRYRIEEGVTVRERQKLFSVVDLRGPMHVTVKIPEVWIDKIAPRQRARISVDAFAGQSLTGTVEDVFPLPDPAGPGARAKVYTTRIKLEDRLPGLRPGMTATADVVIADLADVISVPLGAVIYEDDKPKVGVRGPGGKVEWREVTLGVSNATHVHVKQGIQAGETVILGPVALPGAERERRKPDDRR